MTEPLGIGSEEYFRDVLREVNAKQRAEEYDKALGRPMMWKHYLEPLKLVDGPSYHENPDVDVAAFRVGTTHPKIGKIKLGIHFDDWVYRALWHLSDAIFLGYPQFHLQTSRNDCGEGGDQLLRCSATCPLRSLYTFGNAKRRI